jgi:hypothetical protein
MAKQFGGTPKMMKPGLKHANKMPNVAKGMVFKPTGGASEAAHKSSSPSHKVNRKFGMKV